MACGIPWSCMTLRECAVSAGIPTTWTEGYVPADLELTVATAHRLRRLYESALCVFFVSESNRLTAERLIGLEKVKWHVAPNRVDSSLIAEKSLALADRLARIRNRRREVKVLVASRWTAQKGIDVLLRALALIPEHERPIAHIYGEGPDAMELLGLARQLGVSDQVEFRPWTFALTELFDTYDLFVAPSRAEGMPYAVLEGLAAGIPVIASDIPPIREIDAGCDCIMFVRVGDPRALADALAWCRNNLEDATNRGARGQQHALWHLGGAEASLAPVTDIWSSHVLDS